ncbi:protein LUTEIN DEFICIENT 5, chloroplastic [Phalaenopsis equestris]|uniref:protein LUTEIN DEFICIENT 5, chloroplastic n=1 Tax=Phalaenopsis equestris TaxID=78828 RepID=UPI0009E6264E|nr:protein LUTEIN DEFICIENT 5, chloroplastic [Phalaenopsis equestris]
MAAAAANCLSYSSYFSARQSPRRRSSSSLFYSCFRLSGITAPKGGFSIRCSSPLSPNGRPTGRESENSAVKEEKQITEEKRRSELASRIASGEFTVQKFGSASMLRNVLSKIGPSGRFLVDLLVKLGDGEYTEIPQAQGSFKAVGGQAFFIPLYELYLIYGGIFRLTFGPKSFLIVSDPVLAKHILKDNCKAYSKGVLAEILDFVMGKGLIPADGEIWRVRRRAIVPALHKKYVATMINLFGQASYRLCEKLDRASSDGEDVDMESLFSRLTLDIIGKAVFNYDFDSLTLDYGIVDAVYTVLREAEQRSTSPIPTWEIPIWKYISPRQQKVTKALKLINDTLDELIAICKRMVDQEKLQFHEEYMNEQDPSILHFLLASGDDVSSKQLRDDLMTLLIAGHETSAAVLTWTFYLLSKEPKVVAKLQEEVDSILGDRFPTIEDMKKLKYTTRVINESLRLYPQPPVLIRRSIEADQLGIYPIKRGEDIFISVWNIHRSPVHWENAESFIPERWPIDGPNPNEVNQNFSYLPFGGGPRKCVGDMFATFEIVVATAMLVRRFNFEMAPGAPPVEMTTGATIHTTEGLKMTVTHRFRPPVIPSLEKMTQINGDQPLPPDTCLEGDHTDEVIAA